MASIAPAAPAIVDDPVKLEADSAFDGFPIENDGTVDLALMATEHPEISRFGDVIFEHMRATNDLLKQSSPWIHAGEYPEGALEAHQLIHVALDTVHKDIERLDSMDLSTLETKWGDKSTVRMARKSLIGFAQGIIARLDALQAKLLGPAAALKGRREERAKRRRLEEKREEETAVGDESALGDSPAIGPRNASDDGEEDPIFAECPSEEEAGQARRGVGGSSEGGADAKKAAEANELPPRAKRPRIGVGGTGRASASPWEVEDLLRKLVARIGRPLQPRPLSACRRRLVNLMAIPDLGQSPHLCRDAIEECLGTAQAALEASPSAEVLGRILGALQSIETLANPEGLSAVVVGLVDTTADL